MEAISWRKNDTAKWRGFSLYVELHEALDYITVRWGMRNENATLVACGDSCLEFGSPAAARAYGKRMAEAVATLLLSEATP